jgi:eukaryotic-like serine/threonine-protein kinase
MKILRHPGQTPGARPPRLPELVATGGSQYKRLHRIGAGGMGEVFLGRDTATKQLVIIKFINTREFLEGLTPKQFASFLIRFLNEFDHANGFRHPNIAKVIDTNIRTAVPQIDALKNLFRPGIPAAMRDKVLSDFNPNRADSKDIFIVTEFVSESENSEKAAPPVDQCFRDKVTPQVISRFFVPVFEALALAHDNDIAHRDLKPDNLLVTQTRQGPLVKIIDFGIARDTTSDRKTELTAVGSMLGTPKYMAPSYMMDANNDPSIFKKVDIYAMGTIIFELMTAKDPFMGLSVPEIFTLKQLGNFNFGEIDQSVRAIVQKMLSPNHETNYSSMHEVVQAWRNI